MFCEKCGNRLENHKCRCGYIKFNNPIPVVVALIPVKKNDKVFLLGVKRNISPKKGEIALPGGFQEIESIDDALRREVFEECGLKIEIDHSKTPAAYSTSPVPDKVLIFVQCNSINYEDINWEFKNEETERLELIDEATNIGFPLHKLAIDNFYKKK